MRRWYGLLLGLATIASLLLVALPMFLIRPFVAQTPRGLAISYQLRSINPMATLVLFGIGAWLTFGLWRSSLSRLQKLLVVTASILLLAAVVLARQNHFE